MDKDKIILDCNEYLKTKTSSRFVFSGTFGLYIQGFAMDRDFHDVDVKFLDLTQKEAKALSFEFSPKIHALNDRVLDEGEEYKYVEVEFQGEKLLVFTPKTIINFKKHTLDFIDNKAKIKSRERLYLAEKIRTDLKYLKETYGLE